MDYLIGIVLAVVLFVFASIVRLDRERAFYPTVLMTIALYYVLFAVIGGQTHVLLLELGVASAFFAAAIAGFRCSPWWIVAGLAGHGIFDCVHGALFVDRGVPAWWPAFCMAFDVMAALLVAALLLRRRARAQQNVSTAPML